MSASLKRPLKLTFERDDTQPDLITITTSRETLKWTIATVVVVLGVVVTWAVVFSVSAYRGHREHVGRLTLENETAKAAAAGVAAAPIAPAAKTRNGVFPPLKELGDLISRVGFSYSMVFPPTTADVGIDKRYEFTIYRGPQSNYARVSVALSADGEPMTIELDVFGGREHSSIVAWLKLIHGVSPALASKYLGLQGRNEIVNVDGFTMSTHLTGEHELPEVSISSRAHQMLLRDNK